MKPFFGRPRLFFVLIAALLAVGVISTVSYYRASSEQAGYRNVRARGDTISVGIHYSPMSLYRYGDTLAGLNYEIITSMARLYGDHLKFYPVASSTDALDNLERGVYDVVIADIPMTASLKERFRFTVPVYTDRQVLVSRDTTVTTPLALAGKEVWVVKGSPAVERLENLSREIGDSIRIEATSDYTAEQLLILAATGKIPRAVVNEDVARRLVADYPSLKISTHVSFSQFQSWILNKSESALADTLDAQIERFKATEAYDSLLNKWVDTADGLHLPADSI